MKTPIQCRGAVCLLAAFVSLIPAGFADSANTADVVTAATAFMSPLATAQKTAIDASSSNTNTSCLYKGPGTTNGLANAGIWSNLPTNGTTRNGLRFTELSTANQTNALAVASAALSTSGRQLLDDIRAADRFIGGESTNRSPSGNANSSMWGYGKYFIAFVGSPSTTDPWTFQFGGHHLAYNITYNGAYTSGTPLFAGNEPNSFTDNTGSYAPLARERTAIVALRSGGSYTPVYAALDGTQASVVATALTASAQISGTYSDVVMGPNGTGNHDTVFPKSYPTSGRGQLYSALTAAQQAVVVDYIKIWGNYLHPSIANDLLPVYLSPEALAETYIGYAGSSATLSAANNYFRIDGPRLWIEFSVQGGVYLPSGYHDHGVMRDKLADYGAAYGTTTISTTVRPPVISTQPVAQTVSSGSDASFSVVAASSGTGTATLSYQWYKDGSAISGATASSYGVTASDSTVGTYAVEVISTGGMVHSNEVTLALSSGTPLSISTNSSLAGGVVGTVYSEGLTAAGGNGTYSNWSIASGALPGGITLSNTGVLGGTPTAAGTFTFTIQVGDGASATATKDFTLTVQEPLDVFLSSYGVSSAIGDDDGDGVANVIEFLLGGDPLSSDSAILPSAGLAASGDSVVMVMTFHVVAQPGNVTWTVEYSSDLTNWTTAANGTGGVVIATAPDGDDASLVTVSIPAVTSPLFARLVVNAP